ncbi:single-stranded-DNA-specific exonuclease RecJ [Paenibacillus sophorae]|nr:single-stranded-DNA-specific exonuclease RecJ [Paenibacillus sophorae]
MYKCISKYNDKVTLEFVERSAGHGTEYIIDQVPEDIDLYIAVDSSSNDVEEMKLLSEKGIDCLIIDHHEITHANPYATIVNPQQSDCKYPNKNASGGLLVWKVCSVLDDIMNTYYSIKYVDMAGFSVAADMMSMTEPENRFFFKNSLKNVQHEGFKQLFTALGKDINNLYANDFVYGLSPAVTAATRDDKIILAKDFMMCDENGPNLKGIVKQLVEVNEKRKNVQREALQRLKPTVDTRNKCVICYDPTIGKGYNGLVAQDLSKHFNRPAIVLGNGKSDDIYAGSFRGYDEFPMMSLLSTCKNALYAAGHEGAGGTATNKNNLGNLQEELNQILANTSFDDTQYYDLEFNINELNEKLILHICNFYRVSGRNFKDGKFLIKGIFVDDRILRGKNKDTLEVKINENLKLMKFKIDEEYYNNFPVFSEIEVLGNLNMNYWKFYKPRFRIEKTMQVLIDDYRIIN